MTFPTFAIGGELVVGRLGYGAMALTGPGGWGEPPDRREAIRTLRRAVELGVTLFDTADSYGPEVSELLIAEALHPYPKGLVVATKGGFVREGPWQLRAAGSPAHLREACDGSLRRLRLEGIDLYQLHTVDRTVPFDESVGALAELQAEGKIRHVGLSNVGIAQIEAARRVVPVVSVQNRYSLAARGPEEEAVVDYCGREGLAYLPWQPLGKGLLARARGALRRVASRHGATPAQVALAWLLARSPVVLPIPGTISAAHLEENAGAVALRLDPNDVAELDAYSPPRLTARAVARRLGMRRVVAAAARLRP